MLNSHSCFGKGYKSAVTRGNLAYIKSKIDSSLLYLHNLTLSDGSPLRTSRRHTFITGFHTSGRTLTDLAGRLFDKYSHVHYLLAYKISQDHIETLFSKIRSKSGFNNNPDALQFRSALKGLLIKSDITPSCHANCLELEPESSTVLLTFVRRKKDDPEEAVGSVLSDECTELSSLTEPLKDGITDIVSYIGKRYEITLWILLDLIVL